MPVRSLERPTRSIAVFANLLAVVISLAPPEIAVPKSRIALLRIAVVTAGFGFQLASTKAA